MSEISQRFVELERIILADPGKRGVAAMVRTGDLQSACRSLVDAKRVGIVTGFFVPSASAGESDGPLGAAHLAAALQTFAHVVVCTDAPCLPVVQALAPNATTDADALAECDVLISIERLGRAADGCYYSMRGEDLTSWTAPLDEWFQNRSPGRTTIGVGDGGNEIGMGGSIDAVRCGVASGAKIASVVTTDHLIVAGVSNWGAWALAAGLGMLINRSVLPTSQQAFADLKHLVAVGAVDGVTARCEPTVDGLDWSVHAEILKRLHAVV